MEVVAFEVKIKVAKHRRMVGGIEQVAPVGVEEGSGFFGAGNDGVAHKLGFVSGGVGELTEGKIADGEGEFLIAKLQGFQQERGNPFVNLSYSIKFFLFSGDALLEPQMNGSAVGQCLMKRLAGPYHGLRGTDQKRGVELLGI